MKLAGTRGADQFGGLGTAGVTLNKPYSAPTIGCIFYVVRSVVAFC